MQTCEKCPVQVSVAGISTWASLDKTCVSDVPLNTRNHAGPGCSAKKFLSVMASGLKKQTWGRGVGGKLTCNLVDKVKEYTISPDVLLLVVFFFFNECIFRFLPHWVLVVGQGLCVFAASRGCSLAVSWRLLIAVASLAGYLLPSGYLFYTG